MPIIRIAHIAEGDVFFVAKFDTDQLPPDSPAQRILAGLLSNPVIIETDNPDVEVGWTYDGTTFHPPAGDQTWQTNQN